MFRDKKLKTNRKEKEWMEFESMRNKYFIQLKENIKYDHIGWCYLSNIPSELAQFHINEKSITAFSGDVSVGTIFRGIFKLFLQCFSIKCEYILPNITNEFIEHMFQYRFGSIMLNKKNGKNGIAEYYFNSNDYLINCDLDEDIVPCTVIFIMENNKLKLKNINLHTTNNANNANNTNDEITRYKKANLLANAVTVYHICHHLTNQHIWVENIFCRCIKHLTLDHWIYNFLSPICGDAGLINRTWGLYAITGLKEHDIQSNKPNKECIADLLFISRESCNQMIINSQKLFKNDIFQILDNENQELLNAYKIFVTKIVNIMYLKDKDKTEEWFINTFKIEFTKSNLIDELTKLLFKICVEHDKSHDDFIYKYHENMLTKFYMKKGIPTTSYVLKYHARLISDYLNPQFSSSPESCWDNFCDKNECKQAYHIFQNVLRKVKDKSHNINQYGVMTR